MVNKRNIAVYGLGTETERVLPSLHNQYNIIGLLDGYKVQGKQYGINIVRLEEIIQKIEKIIVVARPGSCKAIVKRIGDICRENNIELIDIRGNNLLKEKKVVYNFNIISEYTKSEILSEISKVDAVSFDLFDTLVMRDIFSFSDLIEIVNVRLNERKIKINNFCERRIMAEKQLSQGRAPTLKEIYEMVMSEYNDIDLLAEELAEAEFETDFGFLTARKEMIVLLKKCKELGKKIYITTDCYYQRDQIEKILKLLHIDFVDSTLVSCEYGTAKTGDLFEHLKEVAGTANILHIGDNDFADVDSAIKHGIKALKIYSGEELLDFVGGLGLTKYISNLSDSIKVGMFIANIFNSPFQFETDDRKICVFDAESIGYLFCAPIIMDFVYWFGEQIERYKIKNIWFCARDGFLIKRLFEYIYSNMKSEYFLTSRISAIRAGVSSESDIEYVDSMKYSGEIEDNLFTRFGIKGDSLKQRMINGNNKGLLIYKDAILEETTKNRINNQKYIAGLNIKDGTIAMFDFVAKGTSQMFLQKMVSNEMMGMYFLQLEPEFMSDKGLNIISFYGEDEKENSVIFDDYYILETILTSPDSSVLGFDENGKAIFAEENRSDIDIACIMKVQAGIVEYVKRYAQICPKSIHKINKKLDEAFLTLLHNIKIENNDFLSLKNEDIFFNRMTEVEDLV